MATVTSVRSESRKVRSARAPKDRTLTEPELWAVVEPIASAAFGFWNEFMALRMGLSNNLVLDSAAKAQWMCIIRAVSWVESKHGTGGASQPARDPIQCGNPNDVWWKELTGQTSEQDRFILGPNKQNYFASELPAAAAADAMLPAKAKLSYLGDQKKGHSDANFNPTLSYYWGIPFLIHRTNAPVAQATFKCGDCSRARLVDGAVEYNGGGVKDYRKRISEALDMMKCMKSSLDSLSRADLEVGRAVSGVFAEVLGSLATSAGDGPNRLFFPQGINLIDVSMEVGGISASIKVSGSSTLDRNAQAFDVGVTATAKAAAHCPSTTPINTNATMTSDHEWVIVNDTSRDILVNIVVRLADSAGHENSETIKNLPVKANSKIVSSTSLLLVAAYQQAGPVTVTATSTLSGGASAADSNTCSFKVS